MEGWRDVHCDQRLLLFGNPTCFCLFFFFGFTMSLFCLFLREMEGCSRLFGFNLSGTVFIIFLSGFSFGRLELGLSLGLCFGSSGLLLAALVSSFFLFSFLTLLRICFFGSNALNFCL